MTFSRRGLWILVLSGALTVAGLALRPPHPAAVAAVAIPPRGGVAGGRGVALGGVGVPAFTGTASCPMAHCNQHMDGREGMANSTSHILTLPVSTPPVTYTTFTPNPPAAVHNGLGCTVGQLSATSVPDMVACAMTNTASNPQGPFLYMLTAGGITATSALSLSWASALYSGTQPMTCATGAPWAMNRYVFRGAPLFDAGGYTYVSDSSSIARFAPGGANGVGVCSWGIANPIGTAVLSWNAVTLPPAGGAGGYPGGYYLVGQGPTGPVALVGYRNAAAKVALWLDDSGGYPSSSGYYVTYNSVAAVQTPGGARLYDATEYCPTNGGCGPYSQVPGRLYAIDVTPPLTATGVPSMTVAFSYTFEGPSGASVMALPASSGAPVGDQIYFDGSGPACATPCSQPEDPTLFALQDNCPFGSTLCNTGALSPTNPYSPTLLFADDFVQLFGPAASGQCNSSQGVHTYAGIQAAPALQAPEVSGGDPNASVWAFAACGQSLYRVDAQTGQPWPGAGAATINLGTLPGLATYYPSSTMNTVVDANTGDTTMFVGAASKPISQTSYVLALDLETGGLFWALQGPPAPNPLDSPFQGQFPIAQTPAGGNVLIAATAGNIDGSSILAIPLS